MKYGVFDHMDLGGGSLAEQYDSRLRLVEAYDRAGFHAQLDLATHQPKLDVVQWPAPPAGVHHAQVGVGNFDRHVLRVAAIEESQILAQ